MREPGFGAPRAVLRDMPFKSKAQRRKFAQLLVDGKITDEQYEEWNRSTGRKALPERLHPAKKPAAQRTVKKRVAKKTATARRALKKTKRKA